MSIVKLRRSTFITTSGAGSIIDFRTRNGASVSVIVKSFDGWENTKAKYIEEPRLAKLLNVENFIEPPIFIDQGNFSSTASTPKIEVSQFPYWLQCPRCRRIAQLRDWDYNDSEPMEKFCPECSRPGRKSQKIYCVPVRFVASCENGHLEDFPWDRFVRHKPGCKSRKLKLLGRGMGIESVYVSCDGCKSSRSLKDAIGKQGFLFPKIECGCKSPWHNSFNKTNQQLTCDKPLRTFQRGSSSLYFAHTKSAISIPPWSEINTFGRDFQTLANVDDEKSLSKAIEMFSEMKGSIVYHYAKKRNYSLARIKDLILSTKLKMEDLDEEKIASQEYIVLKGACSEDVENQENFKADGKIVPQEFKYFIDGISKIKRLREVKALCSFSRVNPSVSNSNRKEVVSKGKTWLPALENFGEGIFIDFESEHLKNWETNKEVILRVEQSTKAFRNAFLKDGKDLAEIDEYCTPRFFLMHTFSHLLIRSLSNICGYSLSSIKERIYSQSKLEEDKNPYAGLLIYTSSSDADGTLGGLAAMAEPENFTTLLQSAIESGRWCSSDPLCINRSTDISLTGSLASCHSCTLLPETSCCAFNRFLDRGLIYGTEENTNIGFLEN